MAILLSVIAIEVTMTKQYSIAEARNQLSKVVHEAEGTGSVELTRRGQPVAVVLSLSEYRRLVTRPARPFWKAIEDLRAEHADCLTEMDGAFDHLRQADAPRDFSW